jgi:hypothetical protein
MSMSDASPVLRARPPAVPRWLSARAARLVGAVVEASIDAVGHARTAARLDTPAGVRTLSLLAGGPEGYERQLAFVGASLRRGLDAGRMGVAVTDEAHPMLLLGSARLPLGGHAGEVVSLPGVRSATYAASAPVVAPPVARPLVVDAVRLSAALHLAHLPVPAPFDRLAKEPGFGPRVLRALALVAEWVQSGPPADEERLVFAVGAMQGRPHGVSLSVYDRTLVALERLLHGSGPEATRVAPLLALARTVADASGRGAVVDPERVLARDARAGADLLLVCAGDAVRPPPLPRRPRRRVHRDPVRYRPMLKAPRALSALDGQGDFFAP